MPDKPNFRPRVVEARLGVELEFHEDIPGLKGDTVVIFLQPEATFEQAKQLCGLLHDLGSQVTITNPKS